MVYEIWSLGCKPYDSIPNAKVSKTIQFVLLSFLTTCRKLWKKLMVDTDSHHLLVVLELFTD